MFSKFSSLFHNATAALTKEQPRHERFKATWKNITNYFINSKDEKVSIDQTQLPLYLDELLCMLVEEEQEGVNTGPCMEFLLHHNTLDTLITLARTDTPPGMKQKVLQFFTKLLSRIKQPLLPHVHVHKPIQKLVKICGETAASPTEAEEIHLLLMLCARLASDPYLVSFFIEVHHVSGKGDGSGNRASLPLVTSLLNLMHSPDARVGVKCCEGLLLCAGIKEDSCVDVLVHHSSLATDLSKQLVSLYRSLPKVMDPIHIHSIQAKWGLDVQCSQNDRLYFPGKRPLVAFLSWLDFLDQLIGSARQEVGQAVAQSIHAVFLSAHLQPAMLQTCEDGAITASAYLAACVRTVSSPLLLHEFSLFILGPSDEIERADSHPHVLRHRLIQRCDHLSEEMCITTLKLFDTLLNKCNAEILQNLVLRNLATRSYMLPIDPASTLSPNSPPNSPNSSKSSHRAPISPSSCNGKSDLSSCAEDLDLSEQNKMADIKDAEKNVNDAESDVLKSFKETVPKSGQSSEKSQSKTTNKNVSNQNDNSAREENTESGQNIEAQNSDETSLDSNSPQTTISDSVNKVPIVPMDDSVPKVKSVIASTETHVNNSMDTSIEALNKDIQNVLSLSAASEMDVLKEIDSFVEDYGTGALAGATAGAPTGALAGAPAGALTGAPTGALTVDCSMANGGEEKDEFISPIGSIQEEDCEEAISPCWLPGHPPPIEQIVSSFLHIVPQEVKSSSDRGETDISSYLSDAHKQVEELYHAYAGVGWPTEACAPSSEEQTFYEGNFLHMLFGKLARMLDQSYDINLHVTSVCARLAMLPHPHTHEYLLNPLLPTAPATPTLYKIFIKLSRDVESRIKSTVDFQKKLHAVRRQLSGYYGDLSNKKTNTTHSFEDSNLLAGVIVLEEFCKEMAAVAFVKQHSSWINTS